MVATALMESMVPAAANAAAPPRECPTRSCGALYSVLNHVAAARRSATFPLKEVSANSPSDWPNPGKSKRKQAIPKSVSCLRTRAAPGVCLCPAKHCAKSAYAFGGESGKSMVPAMLRPVEDGNVTFTECMTHTITGLVFQGLAWPTTVNRNHRNRQREME